MQKTFLSRDIATIVCNNLEITKLHAIQLLHLLYIILLLNKLLHMHTCAPSSVEEGIVIKCDSEENFITQSQLILIDTIRYYIAVY